MKSYETKPRTSQISKIQFLRISNNIYFEFNMKKLEFETSKGKFLVVDAINNANIHTGIKLSEITEEQASEIVDELWNGYKNYNSDGNVGNYNRLVKITAIESLHSLLKSKGIYLYRNPNNSDYFTNRSTEEKTLYNPYIFKL